MLIVGHGPSVISGLGAVIDSHTVVRLHRGLRDEQDRKHWGTRTDYLCARSPRYDHGQFPFWLYDGTWDEYFAQFSKMKPTTGLCAVFTAIDRMHPEEISLLGLDRVMHPYVPDDAPPWLCHDMFGEHECLKSLPVRFIDLRTHEQIC